MPQPTVKTDPLLSRWPSETRAPLPLRTPIAAGGACVEVTGQPDPVKPGDGVSPCRELKSQEKGRPWVFDHSVDEGWLPFGSIL